VLQEEGGEYRLVGVCYVDGLIDGEAMMIGFEEKTFTFV